MIKTPYEELPNNLQDAFKIFVKEDKYNLNPETLYNNTVLTAQNSGINAASEFMHVPKAIVNRVLDLN